MASLRAWTKIASLSLLLAACDSAGTSNGDGGTDNDGGDNDANVNLDMTPCVNLQCQQVTCSGGGKTTVTGSVYDPAGATPLYNAIVYVPNSAVLPFTPGVSCDACGAGISGSPLVTALTGPDGKFTLEDVPVGDNIPLVIQLGRWRRVVTLPTVAACVENPVTDAGLTRLPKNKAEGDIPQMAIATGQADPFECLLRKVGISDSEFTAPSGDGRVHYYRENGIDTMPSAPAGSTLYGDLTKMLTYDIIILPCEGSPNGKGGMNRRRLIDYTNAGGRVFTTHYSYTWIEPEAPFSSVATTWHLNQSFPADGLIGNIDTSFPKGQAFQTWMTNVGATTTPGQLPIIAPRHDVDTINPMRATKWISAQDGHEIVEHFTFNAPVEPLDGGIIDDAGQPVQCGRVVFSDFHVSANALVTPWSMNTPPPEKFPASCKNEPLTAQEKALVFMLFDLSSCVQKDDEIPQPPIP